MPPGRIIVAEDQHINLDILKTYMETLGILENCDFCVNGQIAIDRAKSLIDEASERGDLNRPICLMLLDMQMPKKNGQQVV